MDRFCLFVISQGRSKRDVDADTGLKGRSEPLPEVFDTKGPDRLISGISPIHSGGVFEV